MVGYNIKNITCVVMNMNHPERKRLRIPGYDYATPNYYFVTICTHEKQCLFGTVEQLNGYGQIARDLLLEIQVHYPNVVIDKFVVMPNHIHAIIVLQEVSGDTGKALSNILAQYKSAVSKKLSRSLLGKKIWQKSYFDRIIRSEKGYRDAWRYIDENPLRWYLNRGKAVPDSPDCG